MKMKEHLFNPDGEKIGEREIEVPDPVPTAEEKLEALLDRLENARNLADVRQAGEQAREGRAP